MVDIFVDWGSSNFRAFLLDDDKVIARKSASGGGTLKNFAGSTPETRSRDYSAFFMAQLQEWLAVHPGTPVYICGAVGGREGWVETVYSVAPTGIADVKKNLHKVGTAHIGAAAGNDVYIASGCTIAFADGRHDVIRSEEVKSLGAALHLGLTEGLFCIPGTHCKWVRIEGGKITHFETALSGEIFSILSEHGALAAVFRGEEATNDPYSFDRGLALAAEGFDLLNDLWQVRAQKLRGARPPACLRSYFSGILLGHELRQMEKLFPGHPPTVLLMDAGGKRDFYRRAFDSFNWPIAATVDSEAAVCAGLRALKR